MSFCESPFYYRRRKTREVIVGDPARGGVIIGGGHPVVIQSMLTCDTLDTAECIRQTLGLAAAGCQMVRLTAPTVPAAANLEHIVAGLRARHCLVPLVADIHFKPEAALEAARWIEVVRINPGNYADSKKFAVRPTTTGNMPPSCAGWRRNSYPWSGGARSWAGRCGWGLITVR
jgi:(E)-4-hydroxy-3-methylbut-2-enyl-diphosphate synthase